MNSSALKREIAKHKNSGHEWEVFHREMMENIAYNVLMRQEDVLVLDEQIDLYKEETIEKTVRKVMRVWALYVSYKSEDIEPIYDVDTIYEKRPSEYVDFMLKNYDMIKEDVINILSWGFFSFEDVFLAITYRVHARAGLLPGTKDIRRIWDIVQVGIAKIVEAQHRQIKNKYLANAWKKYIKLYPIFNQQKNEDYVKFCSEYDYKQWKRAVRCEGEELGYNYDN